MNANIKTSCALLMLVAYGVPSFAMVNVKPDLDGNGEVSRQEYMSAARMEFDKQDTNYDGQISKAEREAAHFESLKKLQLTHFRKWDANDDRRLTAQEYENFKLEKTEQREKTKLLARDNVFDEMDVNNNDHVSRMEHNAYWQEYKEERLDAERSKIKAMFSKMDINNDGAVSEAEHYKNSGSQIMILGLDFKRDKTKPKKPVRLDENKDGFVTWFENSNYYEAHFDALDVNNDGYITHAEAAHLF
ncbi:MAG: hypothetical protein ACPGVT_09760 [Maricaulaceae bacterium]